MNQELIKDFRDIAVKNLERDGHLIPVVMLEKRKGGVDVMVLGYEDVQSKDNIQHFIAAQLKTGKYKSFLHIAEAWMVSRPQEDFKDLNDPKFMNVQPSKAQDRQEVLSLLYKDETGSGYVEMIPFIKEKEDNHITMLYENKIQMNDSDSSNSGGNIWDMWK